MLQKMSPQTLAEIDKSFYLQVQERVFEDVCCAAICVPTASAVVGRGLLGI